MRPMIAIFCSCVLAGFGNYTVAVAGERSLERLDLAVDSCWPGLAWNDIAPEGREILSRDDYANLDKLPQVEEAKRDAFADHYLAKDKQRCYRLEREAYFDRRAPLMYGGSMFAITVKTPDFTDLTPQAVKDFDSGEAVLGAFLKLKKSDMEEFLVKYVKVYAQQPYRNYFRPLADTIPDDSFTPWAKNERVKAENPLPTSVFNRGAMEKVEANGIPLRIPFMPGFSKQRVGTNDNPEFEVDYYELRLLFPEINYTWKMTVPQTGIYSHEMLVFWDPEHRNHLLSDKDDILLIEEGDGYFIFGNTATWPTQDGKQMQCDVQLCLVMEDDDIPLVLAYLIDTYAPVREWRKPADYTKRGLEALKAWRRAIIKVNGG